MKKAILGKKLGMTQIFDEKGKLVVNEEFPNGILFRRI